MDALAEQAEQARGAVGDAQRAWYAALAAVVLDERATGDDHGAQARAARRLKTTAQNLSKILRAAGYEPTTGLPKSEVDVTSLAV